MSQRSILRLLTLGAAFITTAGVANTSPSITVTEQRLVDQRIQREVMSVLARNPDLTGRVAVESKDQVVNLSGHLTTYGQIRRAGRDASLVRDVKYVVNEIRPRVGYVNN